MKVLIGSILLLVLIVGPVLYVYLRESRSLKVTNDPRSRNIRRNHAEMVRFLDRIDAAHQMGTIFLPEDEKQELEKLLKTYNNHVL